MKPKSIPSPKPKPAIKVGLYQLGFQWVELWIDPNDASGNFQWMPGDCRASQKPKEHHRITVGIKQELWGAWGVLVHEAFESALCDTACRFHPTGNYVRSSSDCYHFSFDHNKFTEVCARVGSFLCEARSDFEKAYKRSKHSR